MSKVTRKLFSERDDINLKKLVKKFGDQDWELISDKIKKFSPRQCKDRYTVYLSGEYRNDPWTPEEDAKLSSLYKQYGPKWCEICKFFDGRHSNSVKNRWHRYIKPNEIEFSSDSNESTSSPEVVEQIKPKEVSTVASKSDTSLIPPCSASVIDDMFSQIDIDSAFFNESNDFFMQFL